MPHDESLPTLARIASTQTLPAQIRLPDRARPSAPGVPGGVPPMFQLRTAPSTDPHGSGRMSD